MCTLLKNNLNNKNSFKSVVVFTLDNVINH